MAEQKTNAERLEELEATLDEMTDVEEMRLKLRSALIRLEELDRANKQVRDARQRLKAANERINDLQGWRSGIYRNPWSAVDVYTMTVEVSHLDELSDDEVHNMVVTKFSSMLLNARDEAKKKKEQGLDGKQRGGWYEVSSSKLVNLWDRERAAFFDQHKQRQQEMDALLNAFVAAAQQAPLDDDELADALLEALKDGTVN